MVTCGTLTVEADGPGFSEGDVHLVGGSCGISPRSIAEGELAEFSVRVRNRNDQDATVTVSFKAGGRTIVSQSGIHVPANGTTKVRQSATWSFIRSRVGEGNADVEASLSSVQASGLAASVASRRPVRAHGGCVSCGPRRSNYLSRARARR